MSLGHTLYLALVMVGFLAFAIALSGASWYDRSGARGKAALNRNSARGPKQPDN